MLVRTVWGDGADVSWAAVANIRAGGRTDASFAAGRVFVSVFGDQQHFAYRDNKALLWDAWFNGANGTWNVQQLNSMPNAPQLKQGQTNGALAAGDPFVSVFGEQLHFVYRDNNGTLLDAWFDGSNNSWNLQQINDGVGSAAQGLTSGPFAVSDPFVSVFGEQQHFVYRDDHGLIWDAWYNGANGAWTLQNVNSAPVGNGKTNGPPAVGDPFVSVFGEQQHFVYRGDNGVIWDAWYNGANGAWNLQNVNSTPGGSGKTNGPPAVGDPFVSVFEEQQHFVYFDAFGAIWDAWIEGAGSTWNLQQINAGGATAAPLIAPASSLFADVFGQQQHFAYCDVSGALWDAWYDAGSNVWKKQQLTLAGMTDGPAAVSGPFISRFNQQQHFSYVDAVGAIWDVWFDDASGAWQKQQVNASDGTALSGALDNAMWAAMSTIADAISSFATIP